MLTRRKREWFPIVATDLFCGLLGAVIVLNAVSPHEHGRVGDVVFLKIAYPKGPKDNCSDASAVVFAFTDAKGDRLSSLEGSPQSNPVEGQCVVQSILPQVILNGPPTDPSAITAEYSGRPLVPEITIDAPGFFNFTCADENCQTVRP